MMKTEVNFFYFAGSIVGGIVLVGSSLLAGFVFFGGLGDILGTYIASAWGAIYLLSLSFIIGIGLSHLSIRLFYDRAKKSDEVETFREELGKQLGIQIPKSGTSRRGNVPGRFAVFLAFAHNVGHPNSLYDIAGRARLAGTAFINALWIFILTAAMAVWKFTTTGVSAVSLVMTGLCVFSGISSVILLKLTKRTWVGYENRLVAFSVFQYADNTLKRSRALDDFLRGERSPAAELEKQ